MRPKVRLSEEEIKIIKETAKKFFGGNAKVYIFGSRTDLDKKGGDIDIFIETDKNISLKEELKFLVELEKKGIERKVDLIIKAPNKREKFIFKEAKEKGILI
ncbi:Nucleotidyltransferase domain-containing protein [Persephonella hydrogeniphila]|uniref:Nucleotidyltransferase domain-containing protein n=1 Tax=Persephonella hydrogeniphila TaxID=198703 RepID=A0A285NMG1_9AQUI|nr:nucleotidyltransferase domain-containing protein [Persephonella hydrogeniphila]SNZ10645.1 Nucleotidyltransferase domain-containing protein [Persephonella hydrogeniphila]